MPPNIDEIHNAIIKHLPDTEEFTPQDRSEASNLIRAALLSLIDPEESHPSEVKKLLTGFENGYGCWLETVEEAMHKGLADLPDAYNDYLKGEVEGAFQMAKVFLFDIEGYNAKFER